MSRWYLEPGFEKQRDTPEGQLASDLYSERTYVLARAFVRRAVEPPPITGGLAEALTHLYFGPPARLSHVVRRAQRTVDASEAHHAALPLGGRSDGDDERPMALKPLNGAASDDVLVLTKGSLIPLKRTLAALERRLAMSS